MISININSRLILGFLFRLNIFERISMDKYEQFKEYLGVALEKLKELDKKETIRLVSHLDADGICAASIMVKALNTDNRKYLCNS